MLLVKNLELLNGKKISLELNDGGEYVLRGSNGCGKTLLLRALAALYAGAVSEFSLNGKSHSDYSPEEFRSRVMYVSPSTAMSPEMTAEEFLLAPLKLAVYEGFVPTFSAVEYLKEWGMEKKTLGHLSSGQKQLLGLLRVLTLKADILLLDEPTSHMDHEKTLVAENLVRDWKRVDPKRIFLVVSHSEEQAQRFGTNLSFTDLTAE